MDHSLTSRWFDSLLRIERVRRAFSDRARLQGMLDFESALAEALATVGIIPPAAAEAIASQCSADLFDLAALFEATAAAGNTAIPVVRELERLVAASDAFAARYVHFGATSQDAMDTGLVLQLREAIGVLETDLEQLHGELARLAEAHKETPMVGRTWLQAAAPITFGLKVAGWASAVARHQERLEQLRPRCLALQLGGPVGTLAAYGDRARQVTALVAEKLQLVIADLPWHAHRDRLAEVAATLGLVVGTLGKMAGDIALLSQTEIAEAAEPAVPGRGGSSSMPQKQNPVGCGVVLAAATRVPPLVCTMLAAMPQQHERGLGGWQAEWETLPEVFELTAGAVAQMKHIVSGLTVDAGRMRLNLAASGGLVFAESVSAALTAQIGRSAAHALVERACQRCVKERRELREILMSDPEVISILPFAEIAALFDLERHTSAVARLIDASLLAGRPRSSAEEDK